MFSLRATLSFLRYVFAERKRIYYKIGNMLLGGKGGFATELKGVASEEKRIYHGAEKALFWRKSEFFTELKRRCFGGKADLSRG